MKFVTQTTLALMVSLVFGSTSAVAQSKLENDSICDPIGRILKSNQQNLVGKLLCGGDEEGLQANLVLCFFNPSEQKCRPKKAIKESSANNCPFPSRSFCKRKKGGTRSEKPTIITPYGRWLLETRPTLSWLAVPGATKYQITVESQRGNLWSKIVSATSIPFPREHELSSEDVYKISVVAYQNDAPFVASSSVYRLLSPADATDLRQMIRLIRSFNLDPDRAAFLDLNAAYLSRGLLNESIQVLESRVQAGSDHPDVFRVLAERYIDVGLLDRAKESYIKAQRLAESQGDQIALKKAEQGLQALEGYLKPAS